MSVVRFHDRGLKEILTLVTKAGKLVARAGVLDPQASAVHPLRGNITIGEVAHLNEFGSERAHVPRRSFLKRTLTKNPDLIRMRFVQTAERVLEGMDPRVALQKFGHHAVEMIQKTIDDGVLPANAPMTIREKGHDHTLIHTETLVESISHDVMERSNELFADMYSGETITRYRSEEYASLDYMATAAEESGE